MTRRKVESVAYLVQEMYSDLAGTLNPVSQKLFERTLRQNTKNSTCLDENHQIG